MTREQQLSIYRSRCFEYGFQPGTIEFAQCMQQQEAQERWNTAKEKQGILYQQNVFKQPQRCLFVHIHRYIYIKKY